MKKDDDGGGGDGDGGGGPSPLSSSLLAGSTQPINDQGKINVRMSYIHPCESMQFMFIDVCMCVCER